MRPTTCLSILALFAVLSAATPTLPSFADADVVERDGAGARDLHPASEWPGLSATTSDAKIELLSVGGREIDVGSPVRFQIKSNQDGFAHLFVVSASGRVQLWMENVPVEAKRTLRFPNSGLTIEATAPEGRDRLLLIVSRKRLDGFSGTRTVKTPRDLALDEEEFQRSLDGMMADYPRTDWTWTTASVEVIDR